MLDKIQMSRIYNDSKTFVDMKLRKSPAETLTSFDAFIAKNMDPNKDELQAWVEENFDEPGKEFENWIPDDYTKTPEILNRINDKGLKDWARSLNEIWLELGRKMRKDVAVSFGNCCCLF